MVWKVCGSHHFLISGIILKLTYQSNIYGLKQRLPLSRYMNELHEEFIFAAHRDSTFNKTRLFEYPMKSNSYQEYLPQYYKENRLNSYMHFLYIASSYPFVLLRGRSFTNHVSYCSSVAVCAYETFPTKEQFHTVELSNMPNRKILARLLFASEITISW